MINNYTRYITIKSTSRNWLYNSSHHSTVSFLIPAFAAALILVLFNMMNFSGSISSGLVVGLGVAAIGALLGLLAEIYRLLQILHDDIIRGELAAIQIGAISWGFFIFLFTEVILFAACFAVFIHFAISPVAAFFLTFPPVGLVAIFAFGLPLSNLFILVYSSSPLQCANELYLRAQKTAAPSMLRGFGLGEAQNCVLIISYAFIGYVAMRHFGILPGQHGNLPLESDLLRNCRTSRHVMFNFYHHGTYVDLNLVDTSGKVRMGPITKAQAIHIEDLKILASEHATAKEFYYLDSMSIKEWTDRHNEDAFKFIDEKCTYKRAQVFSLRDN